MKLEEKELNVFSALKKLNPNLKLFTYVEAETLDLYLNKCYSFRTLSPIGENDTIDNIANYVNVLFSHKWDDIITGYEKGLDNLLSFGTVEKRHKDYDSNSDGSNTDTNTVTGFNDDDFTNDTKTESKRHDEGNETTDETITRSNARYFSDIWNFLLQNNIITVIVNDVGRIIFLSVF